MEGIALDRGREIVQSIGGPLSVGACVVVKWRLPDRPRRSPEAAQRGAAGRGRNWRGREGEAEAEGNIRRIT